MKKLIVLILTVFLGGCASLGVKPSCPEQDLQRVSYFAEGQKLVAFRFVAQASGYQIDGILQIKKAEGGLFDVTAYASAGGYRLMTAQVSEKGVDFAYVLPLLDHAVVRGKVQTFLTALLFPPQKVKSCRQKGTEYVLSAEGGNYRYYIGQEYPFSLTYKKTLGSVSFSYEQYAPYEQGQVPHYVYYRDGGRVGVELVLVSLKK